MAKTPPPRFYKAEDVFKSAISFNQACEFLKRADPDTEPHVMALLGHPLIALSALTLELCLKTIHAVHSDFPVPQTHNLGDLFRGLSGQHKRDIQKLWQPIYTEWHERWDHMRILAFGKEAPKTPSLVAMALDDASTAFEHNRYAFEEKAQNGAYYVDDLRKPLIGYVVKLRPALGVWKLSAGPRMSWEDAAQAAADLTKKSS